MTKEQPQWFRPFNVSPHQTGNHQQIIIAMKSQGCTGDAVSRATGAAAAIDETFIDRQNPCFPSASAPALCLFTGAVGGSWNRDDSPRPPLPAGKLMNATPKRKIKGAAGTRSRY